MRSHWLSLSALLAVIVAFSLIVVRNRPGSGEDTLVNVSYDPTRELYQHLNAAFESDYAQRTGRHVHVVQSHGGSSRQSRAVIAGQVQADVVTLGLFADVDALRKRGLIADGWADRLPHHSQPYTSTIVFVVRKSNPKQIHDWPDLLRPGVEIITPDPKTSGNGKLSALAAWGAILTRGGTEDAARSYLVSFYQHVRVLDAGARVAWVDATVRRRGTFEDARSYLEFLFGETAQQIIADLGYRPYQTSIGRTSGAPLPSITLFPITAIARDWDAAQERFFAENGLIDGILKEARP